MALIQPPITGDAQLDAWTFELANQLNSGALVGAASVASGKAGTNGNSSIYLYQRTDSGTVAPPRPTLVSYDLDVSPVSITANNDWESTPSPVTATDKYLWVTFRYVADRSGVIEDENSWDTPVLLGQPGADAVTVTISTPTGTNILRSDTDVVVLSADVYKGGVLQTPDASWTYAWTKDITVLTAANQATETGATQGPGEGFDKRLLRVEGDGITDNTASVFSCVVTEP